MENLIKLTLDVVITETDVEDIMQTALDGITYWADAVKHVGEWKGDDACEHIANGGELRIHLSEGPITEGGPRWYTLSLEKLVRGIKQYLMDPETDMPGLLFNNGVRTEIEPGDIDAAAADLIVQYALFGEQVFA